MAEKKCQECIVDEPFTQCENDPCCYTRRKPLSVCLKESSALTKPGPSRRPNVLGSPNVTERSIRLNDAEVELLFGKSRVSKLNSLLSDGTDINGLKYIDDEPLLIWACKNNYPVLVKLLLDNGANPKLTSNNNENAMYIAIKFGYCTHVIDVLIKYEYKHDNNVNQVLLNMLSNAITLNKLKMVKHLLHWGVDLIACGLFLLGTCYLNKNITIFKMLMSHGVKMENATRGKSTLAYYIMKPLILKSYDEIDKELFDIFIFLLEHEGLQRCEEFELATAGRSLLHIAAGNKFTQYLEHLLKLGLDPNVAENLTEKKPLHYAAEHCNMRGYQLLLSYGSYESPLDRNGNTVLHQAVIDANYESLRNLLLYDERPGEVNFHGKTALHLALDNDDDVSIEWLTLFGVKLTEVSSYIYDETQHKKIRAKVTRYAVMRRAAGIQENLSVFMDEELRKFENDCLKELDKMKNLKILDCNINCDDLLRANKRVLTEMASKSTEKELLNFYNTEIAIKFPIYANILWKHINVAIRYAPVYDKAIDNFYRMVDGKLPSAVIEEIMSYLHVKHMENIVKTSQNLKQ